MFSTTPMGIHMTTDNGWTISVSLGYGNGKFYFEKGECQIETDKCEVAVWPTALERTGYNVPQEDWIRWGQSSVEPPIPEESIFDRTLSGLSTEQLCRLVLKLTDIEPESSKWLGHGLIREEVWLK